MRIIISPKTPKRRLSTEIPNLVNRLAKILRIRANSSHSTIRLASLKAKPSRTLADNTPSTLILRTKSLITLATLLELLSSLTLIKSPQMRKRSKNL